MRDICKVFEVHPRAAAPGNCIEGVRLSDVYDSYSYAKERAYDYCKALEEEFDGWNGGIVSHNTFTFTYMFDFVHPETGEIMRAHITPAHNHAYYL